MVSNTIVRWQQCFASDISQQYPPKTRPHVPHALERDEVTHVPIDR